MKIQIVFIRKKKKKMIILFKFRNSIVCQLEDYANNGGGIEQIVRHEAIICIGKLSLIPCQLIV